MQKPFETVHLSGGPVTFQGWNKNVLRGHGDVLMRFLITVSDWLIDPDAITDVEGTLTLIRRVARLSLAPGSDLPTDLSLDDHMLLAGTMIAQNTSEDGWGKAVGAAMTLRSRLMQEHRDAVLSSLFRSPTAPETT